MWLFSRSAAFTPLESLSIKSGPSAVDIYQSEAVNKPPPSFGRGATALLRYSNVILTFRKLPGEYPSSAPAWTTHPRAKREARLCALIDMYRLMTGTRLGTQGAVPLCPDWHVRVNAWHSDGHTRCSASALRIRDTTEDSPPPPQHQSGSGSSLQMTRQLNYWNLCTVVRSDSGDVWSSLGVRVGFHNTGNLVTGYTQIPKEIPVHPATRQDKTNECIIQAEGPWWETVMTIQAQVRFHFLHETQKKRSCLLYNAVF